MKRSDITTRMVLLVVQHSGVLAWDYLSADRPAKVVLAAIQREVDAGNLDYGVWLGRPHLTDKGRAWLAGQVSRFASGGPVGGPGDPKDDRVPFRLAGCIHSAICRSCLPPTEEAPDA